MGKVIIGWSMGIYFNVLVLALKSTPDSVSQKDHDSWGKAADGEGVCCQLVTWYNDESKCTNIINVIGLQKAGNFPIVVRVQRHDSRIKLQQS